MLTAFTMVLMLVLSVQLVPPLSPPLEEKDRLETFATQRKPPALYSPNWILHVLVNVCIATITIDGDACHYFLSAYVICKGSSLFMDILQKRKTFYFYPDPLPTPQKRNSGCPHFLICVMLPI